MSKFIAVDRIQDPRVGNYRPAIRTLLGVALALAWTHSAGADFLNGVNSRNLTHDGQPRFYDVHAPASYDGLTPVPLVLDLHGLSSSKTAQRDTISGWATVSETGGFLVAYPQGLHGLPGFPEQANPASGLPVNQLLGPSWNAGDFCCGEALTQGEDDAGFLHRMIVEIAREGNVDTSRIYLTGLSNGGAMTQTQACRGAHLYAAYAPVAFPGSLSPQSTCVPSRDVPIITFQGLTDVLIPYGGGYIESDPSNPSVLSAQTTFEFWRDTNTCSGSTPDQTELIGSESMCERYTSCGSGTEVELCTVVTPTTAPLLGHVLYFNNDNVDIPQRSWDFMSPHSLPPVDLNGSWQFNYSCDESTGHTVFVQVTENTTTGDYTATNGGQCGSSTYGSQIIPVDTCSLMPDPFTGSVSGISFSSPPSNFSTARSDYETPFVYTPFCGSTPIAAAESEVRNEGFVTEFNGSTATRVEGATHFGQLDFLDQFDVPCLSIDLTGTPPACTFYGLRNDVSPGANVEVEPIDGGTVTFDNVTTPGTVDIVVTTESSIGLPPNFEVIDPPIFYVIETSASFTGDVQVCLPYPDDDNDGIVDGTGIAEGTLEMLRNGVAPSPQFVDGVENKVCGDVPGFSEFVLGSVAATGVDGLSPPGVLVLCFALMGVAALASRLRGTAVRH